jgi:DNA-binding response OmpR family regulator
MRTLILDDDPIQLELAGAALKCCGYGNFEAREDVEASLSQIESGGEAFDLYLLDVLMPGVDGIEACRRIRYTLRGAHAAIVMMTARTDRGCIDQAFSAGADDYIIKPFDDIELSNRLANVFRRKQMPETSAGSSDLYVGQAIETSSIQGLTSASAMEAYLSALDKGRASLSMATAFQVQDWEARTRSLSSHETSELVRSLATMIQNYLTQTTHVLSYFGGGSFVCITKLADPSISARMARALQSDSSALDCTLTMYRNMESCPYLEDPLQLIKAALLAVRTPENPAEPPKSTVLPDLFQF